MPDPSSTMSTVAPVACSRSRPSRSPAPWCRQSNGSLNRCRCRGTGRRRSSPRCIPALRSARRRPGAARERPARQRSGSPRSGPGRPPHRAARCSSAPRAPSPAVPTSTPGLRSRGQHREHDRAGQAARREPAQPSRLQPAHHGTPFRHRHALPPSCRMPASRPGCRGRFRRASRRGRRSRTGRSAPDPQFVRPRRVVAHRAASVAWPAALAARELTSVLQRGDRLVVSELSRLTGARPVRRPR